MKFQTRPCGALERSDRRGLYRRLTLRRADGRVYLNRWGVQHPRLGAIFLHRMDAPDPGIDLHDHPWTFVTVILKGGYVEQRANIRHAVAQAWHAENGVLLARGRTVTLRPGSVKMMRLDECHTIFRLLKEQSWSLVLAGPVRCKWGFYTPDGYLDEKRYDETVRAGRRDLWSDQNTERPW